MQKDNLTKSISFLQCCRQAQTHLNIETHKYPRVKVKVLLYYSLKESLQRKKKEKLKKEVWDNLFQLEYEYLTEGVVGAKLAIP